MNTRIQREKQKVGLLISFFFTLTGMMLLIGMISRHYAYEGSF
eukprot:SAG11_NODE_3566_length_2367_cov_3.410935_2_plen_43_part_00